MEGARFYESSLDRVPATRLKPAYGSWAGPGRDTARIDLRIEPPPLPFAYDETLVVDRTFSRRYSRCHRAQGVLDQVLSRYAGKVRLVHLDFPLEGHPGSIPAARAARCAGEQGKFWEYHRSLMTAPGALDDGDLKGRAASLRLDASPSGSCLASDRHDAAIRAGLEQGTGLGVTGTPAYFVNGRMISGARPIESFTEVIDAELASRARAD